MMPEPSFALFTTLRCPACQGEDFARILGLSTRAGSGTVETPRGYQCLSCHGTVDLSEMRAQQELAQLEQEVADRKARMATLTTKPAPGAPRPSGT